MKQDAHAVFIALNSLSVQAVENASYSYVAYFFTYRNFHFLYTLKISHFISKKKVT